MKYKAAAQPTTGYSTTIQETMFFMRLRRHAKIVFLLLAVLFALSFTLLGVGTGGSFGDIIRSILDTRTTNPVNTLIDATKKNPKSAVAWYNLGEHYQGEVINTDTASITKYAPLAVDALNRYVKLSKNLKPRASALQLVGYLEGEIASVRQTAVQTAIADYQQASGALGLNSSFFNTALGEDPLVAPAVNVAEGEYSQAQKSYLQAAKASEVAYKQWKSVVAKVDPSQTSYAELNLGMAAQSAGDTATAIANYKAFLKLVPHGVESTRVRQAMAALEKQAGLTPQTVTKPKK